MKLFGDSGDSIMKDEDKTKEQLIEELMELRRRIDRHEDLYTPDISEIFPLHY